MSKPVVVICKTTPEKVLKDIPRFMEMAGLKEALNPKATTILKDNISWHYPLAALRVC